MRSIYHMPTRHFFLDPSSHKVSFPTPTAMEQRIRFSIGHSVAKTVVVIVKRDRAYQDPWCFDRHVVEEERNHGASILIDKKIQTDLKAGMQKSNSEEFLGNSRQDAILVSYIFRHWGILGVTSDPRLPPLAIRVSKQRGLSCSAKLVSRWWCCERGIYLWPSHPTSRCFSILWIGSVISLYEHSKTRDARHIYTLTYISKPTFAR